MKGKVYQRKCILKGCNVKFVPLGPNHVACSWPHGMEYAKNVLKKKANQEEKDWKKEKKIRKEKLKTLGQLEQEAKTVFQKWVRMRDKDQPCISCGSTKAKNYDGGHWWKAEIYSGLIFHEDNCHKQCSRPCNMDLAGDPANYRIGLVKRIGIERVEWLEQNKDRLRNYKFTRQELIELKQHYKDRIKELEIKSKL